MARTAVPITVINRTTGAAIQGASVEIRRRADNSLASVYQKETGSLAAPNPLITDINGKVSAWVERDGYKATVSGTGIPTPYVEYFDSAPMIDGSLDWDVLAADIQRQFAPLGSVVDWWRPDNTIGVPTGWEIADGRTITAGNHDFPIVGAITLPDMRNAFSIGADTSKADASAGTPESGVAPGVRGAGGANAKNMAHTHDLGNHTHSTPVHSHTISGEAPGTNSHAGHVHAHDIGIAVSGAGRYYVSQYPDFSAQRGYRSQAYFTPNVDQDVGYTSMQAVWAFTDSSGAHSHTVNTHSHGGSTGSGGASTSGTPSTNTSGSSLSATQSVVPKYVGLLKIVKVRRS